MVAMNEMRLKTVMALARRDLLDAARNPAALVMVPACLALAYVFGGASGSERFAPGEGVAFLMTFVVCVVPAFIGSVMILYVMAEERERGVYVTLAHAGVSAGEVAAGKLVAAFAGSALVEAVVCLALGFSPAQMGVCVGLGLLAMAPLQLLSLACGCVADEQMRGSLLALPVTIAAVSPLLCFISDGLRAVGWLLPTGGAVEGIRALCGSGALVAPPLAAGSLLLWTAATAAFAARAHRRFSRALADEALRR